MLGILLSLIGFRNAFWFEVKDTYLGGANPVSLSAGAPLYKKNAIALPQL